MTHQHVVVGMDGSLVAVRALDWAADEAARRGAGLRVVYAVPDRDEAGPVLASAVARVAERHPGLPVVTAAAEGGAVRALERESEDAVLTVVGTRGFGGLTGLLFGSVSLRLAAHLHGPLLVVRGGNRCDGGDRDVLLGLENEWDADAAAYAFEEAERRGARLRVLHSWTHRHITPELPSLVPATSPGQEQLAQEERDEEAVPRFTMARLREQHPEVGVESRTVRTAPAHALLEATREAAVVVIGAHRRTSRLGPQLGPVAHTLLHRSHCPVLVVPAA
ncbi:stress-inducible protein [Streptomyces sp. MMG1533]|uniref:universal stress protein n=1 Tax=Streptomyces sp. MMG1533 TaxID=1415546 RepID=UPI0006C62A19|nr:universal stress protein [Streptomyces sp. MMG1533]KOU58112.1 stress-inducible protein [Streptomyces sp. MMG1533]